MNKNRTIIILGSSNSNGNTKKIVTEIIKRTKWDFVDLKTKKIHHFDYEFKNQDDDFLITINELVNNYDTLIFATPVYWYTMSGIMKVFFDRISDLLKIHKSIGRQLRSKKMAVIACGADSELVEGFYMPFQKSAVYLGMEYIGEYYGNLEENSIEELTTDIQDFIKKIKSFEE